MNYYVSRDSKYYMCYIFVQVQCTTIIIYLYDELFFKKNTILTNKF